MGHCILVYTEGRKKGGSKPNPQDSLDITIPQLRRDLLLLIHEFYSLLFSFSRKSLTTSYRTTLVNTLTKIKIVLPLVGRESLPPLVLTSPLMTVDITNETTSQHLH